jgi:hypothetical protein
MIWLVAGNVLISADRNWMELIVGNRNGKTM